RRPAAETLLDRHRAAHVADLGGRLVVTVLLALHRTLVGLRRFAIGRATVGREHRRVVCAQPFDRSDGRVDCGVGARPSALHGKAGGRQRGYCQHGHDRKLAPSELQPPAPGARGDTTLTPHESSPRLILRFYVVGWCVSPAGAPRLTVSPPVPLLPGRHRKRLATTEKRAAVPRRTDPLMAVVPIGTDDATQSDARKPPDGGQH